MARIWGILILAASSTALAAGQQAATSAPAQPAKAQPERVKVYSEGPGVTPPLLLPLAPQPLATGRCQKKLEGTVVLSILVTGEGRARRVTFLQPTSNDLDILALRIASADRFTPGTHDGVAATFGRALSISMKACVAEREDVSGKATVQYLLKSQPVQSLGALPEAENTSLVGGPATNVESPEIQKVGGPVIAPRLIRAVDATYSDAARKARLQGVCLLSVIIDSNGMPREVTLKKALGLGLDEKAIEAIQHYRFKPALKDGTPVSVMMNIEIEFKLIQ